MSFSVIQLEQYENRVLGKVEFLQRELNKLRSEFYSVASLGFKQVFSTGLDNKFILLPSTHKMKSITSVMFLNADDEIVSVYFKKLSDNTIEVESKIPLINFTILLK